MRTVGIGLLSFAGKLTGVPTFTVGRKTERQEVRVQCGDVVKANSGGDCTRDREL
jgi:hypothetical protein